MAELGRGAPHIMVLSRALFVFPLMEVRSRVLCVAACYLSRARHDSSASRLTCAASLLIYCIAIVSRSLATPGLQYHRRISRRYVSLSLLVSIPTSSGRLFSLSSSPPLALATASLFSLLRHFSFLFLLYLSKPSPFLNSLFHPLFFLSKSLAVSLRGTHFFLFSPLPSISVLPHPSLARPILTPSPPPLLKRPRIKHRFVGSR